MKTLDEIRGGGGKLILLAEDRLEAALRALREGRFDEAMDRAMEAGNRLTSLADAERRLASLERGSQIVPATEIKEGTHLTGYGEVTEVERVTRPRGDEVLNVKGTDVQGEEWRMAIDARYQVVVETGGGGA